MDNRRKNKLSLSGVVALATSLAAASWSAGDIDDVTTYLARTFYRVPCPVC